jgi:beta-glucanase (GH16 family)
MMTMRDVKWSVVRNASFIGALVLTNAIAGGWKLFWSDEFDSTALNDGYWAAKAYRAGAFNNEEQQYIAGHDQPNSNVFVKNGNLIIVAKKIGGTITSGRIEGDGLKSFTHGRMEARMRLPITDGMWPAFWMMGGHNWPACGELDIMEGKGRLPGWTSGSYHFTNFDLFNQYTLPKGNVHDDFHLYAAEMTSDSVRWYFDTVNFATLTTAQNPDLPFDNPYYFILNVAVGGNFDVASDNTTDFPESLVVDYVRVYHWDSTLVAKAQASQPAARAATLIDAGGKLLAVLPAQQACSAEILSVKGERVLGAAVFARTFSLDLRSLPSGVYFAFVRGGFGEMGRRIVVRR